MQPTLRRAAADFRVAAAVLRAAAAVCALGALGPTGAAAQAVLDWPLLIEARPAALVSGAGATLGNPAGLADLDGRAEGLVSDLETPDAMGLRALSLAGGVLLFDRLSVGAAYRHVGVGDMQRTDGPPLGTPGSAATSTLDVAEDVYALAAAVRLRGIALGGALRLDTPADQLGGEESWAGALGAAYAPRIPIIDLQLAGSIAFERDDHRLAAALEVGAPPLARRRLALALAYGTETRGTFRAGEWRESPLATTHRLVLTGAWHGIAELQLGGSAQPGAGVGAEWVPIVAGLVHLGRYDLGIVREHLPNGFGAAMHYRLSVAF